ncbi:MAG: 50S ribosomal protein L30 [Flavobacteriaceae bacterium]|nr:50S ribosomal protein L30 [Flavobacteriaceae bacterium]
MAKIEVTQVKSRIGQTLRQKRTLDALGLNKLNKTVSHDDTETVLGMVAKVAHLVSVTETI